MAAQSNQFIADFRLKLDNGDINGARQALNAYEASADKSLKTVRSMENELRALGRVAVQTGGKFKELAQQAQKFRDIGQDVVSIGYDLNSAFDTFFRDSKQGIDNYVRAFGRVEAQAAGYNDALKRIESANLRIGRLGAQALIPQMQAQAAAAERWARFLEKYPGIAGGMAQAGAAVESATATLTKVGQVAQGVGALVQVAPKFADLAAKISTFAAGTQQMAAASLNAKAAEDGLAAATLQEGAATQQVAAATTQRSASSAGWVSSGENYAAQFRGANIVQDIPGKAGLKVADALTTVAGKLSAIGGLLAGVTVSGQLAKPGVNDSPIMKTIDDAVGDISEAYFAPANMMLKSLGLGTVRLGFQFSDLGTTIQQGVTVAAYALGGGMNAFEDFAYGITNSATLIFTGVGTNLTRSADHAAEFALQVGNLAGTFDSAAGAAGGLESSWPQALEAYVSFAQETQAAMLEYTQGRTKMESDGYKSVRDAATRFNEERNASAKAFNDQQRESFDQFTQGQLKAVASFYDNWKKEDRENAHQLQRDDEDRAYQRVKDIEKFGETEQESETAYYQERLTAADDFGKEALDREREHQKAMRRMAEDNSDELEELGRARDFGGMVRAMRRQEKERRRAEEDYADQGAAAKNQEAEKLADLEAQFQKEREKRAEDFAKRLAEEDEALTRQRQRVEEERQYQRDEREHNFQAERSAAANEFSQTQRDARDKFTTELAAKTADFQNKELPQLRTQNAARLREYDDQYAKESRKREVRFNEQLVQLDAALLGETTTRDAYYKIMGDNLKTWLGAQSAMIAGGGTASAFSAPTYVRPGESGLGTRLPALPKLATGGYTGAGGARLTHPGEYMLSAPAVNAAERIVGARLTQARVISAMTGGGAGGGLQNISVTNVFPGGSMTSADRAQLLSDNRQAALQGLALALEGMQ